MENKKRKPYFMKNAIITFYDGTEYNIGLEGNDIQDKPISTMQEIILDKIIGLMNKEYIKSNPPTKCRLIVSYI
jgi:hypothetical protein